MGTVRDVLFIMCDQLRADYLSGNGHPTLETPHLDALDARGVNFTRAYCQSPVCGPARMSFYTVRERREAAFSELDYTFRPARLTLGINPYDARAFMVRTADWKYIHYEGFAPQLFDLHADPPHACDDYRGDGRTAHRQRSAARHCDWRVVGFSSDTAPGQSARLGLQLCRRCGVRH